MLSFLKYAGLLLATASSVWGAISETSRLVDGRKVLTPAGRVAVGLTLLGLLVSIGSNILQDRAQERARDLALRAEIERTNRIIISGQPLTSLRLDWRIADVDPALAAKYDTYDRALLDAIADAQGPTTGFIGGSIENAEVVHPFLLDIARSLVLPNEDESEAQKASKSVLVLIGIDDDRYSVLSFGRLTSEVSWVGDSIEPSPSLSQSVSHCGPRACDGGLPTMNVRSIETWPRLLRAQEANAGNTYDLSWDLDPTTLTASLDKQGPTVIPTAKFPGVLKVMVLFDIEALPFRKGDFAHPAVIDLWGSVGDGEYDLRRKLRSGISLTANGLPESRVDYALTSIKERVVLGDHGDPVQGVRQLLLTFTPTNPGQGPKPKK